MPVGFLLNNVQYYYVTDLSGNVKGITDANGELVASYEYDEWGKLLALTPAEDGNEEQIAVATKNPIRYRGYYYDNETGLYYLQSRYYSPDLCRFISPDDFDYINNSSTLYLNAYAYCYNNAVSLSDAEGTTPQLAMNVADISAFVKHIGAKAKETAKESLEKAKALLNKTVEKLKEMWAKLEEKRSKTLEDLKYFIKYPDFVINNALSKLLNKEVKIRFRLVELIRKAVEKAELTKAEKSSSDNNSNSSSKAKAKAKSKNDDSNNIVNAILQGLIAAIELDWFNELLKSFGSNLDQLAKKSFEATKQIALTVITSLNVIFAYFKGIDITTISNGFPEILKLFYNKSGHAAEAAEKFSVPSVFSLIFSLISFSQNMETAGNGTFSKSEDTAINVIILSVNIIAAFMQPVAGIILSLTTEFIAKITALRIKGAVY